MRCLAKSLMIIALGGSLFELPCTAQQPTWVKINTTTPLIGGSVHNAMAYDVARQRIVLFEGTSTWEYDGKNWMQMKPTTSPLRRSQHAIAYDSSRRRTVLFGGWVIGGGLVPDTWEWDGKNWTQMKPTASPSFRMSHAMAYDAARQRTVLFGGLLHNGAYMADIWEWDGQNWALMNPLTSPPARCMHAMAYDSARQRCVLFAGSRRQTPPPDTWEWDGQNWTQLKPTASPTDRYLHAMAYDSNRQRIVLFGGGINGGGFDADTWTWDGRNWTQLNPTTSPPASMWYGMAYDAGRRRAVLCANTLSQNATWELVIPTLTADTLLVPVSGNGLQRLTLDAGRANARRLYWLLGSLTGTSPGVRLVSPTASVTIPLVPDAYTDITIAFPNTAVLRQTKGALDTSGRAGTVIAVPRITDPKAIGLILYHAYVVYDRSNNFYLASDPVPLKLMK